jgi:hypothetical protein
MFGKILLVEQNFLWQAKKIVAQKRLFWFFIKFFLGI